MDFLERYFTDLSIVKQTTIQTKMADDKVFFRKGRPQDLYQVADTMPDFYFVKGHTLQTVDINKGVITVQAEDPTMGDVSITVNP